jgi:hypothetical protein
LQKYLGVEVGLQEFGVEYSLGDRKNNTIYPQDSLRYSPSSSSTLKKLIQKESKVAVSVRILHITFQS